MHGPSYAGDRGVALRALADRASAFRIQNASVPSVGDARHVDIAKPLSTAEVDGLHVVEGDEGAGLPMHGLARGGEPFISRAVLVGLGVVAEMSSYSED
jgi:hypothetical protein